ncbi:siderophore-interacting protein [Actinoplanes sp. NPDC020271]|uniref:siderophore-interacting protein n=1 Tax=Actinoplanes sp. NPDC020271 TaxID=3363896 RepID=UPI00379CC3D0
MIGISTPARPLIRLTLQRLEKAAPRMTRMVVAGPALAHWNAGPFTDTYVRIVFPRPGVAYPDDLDMSRIRTALPRAAWPRFRTYTVRSFDRAAAELSIDIFDHGCPGLTPSWLATLRRGDPVLLCDPRGRYRPRAEADWHLLAGDAVALPAIAVTLEAMAPGTRVTVLAEVGDAREEQPLPTAANAEIRWVHRSRGQSLTEAVRSLAFEPGVVQAFVHGEGGAMRGLRRFLLEERGVARALLSISGYWRRGLNDEQWRQVKATEADR